MPFVTVCKPPRNFPGVFPCAHLRFQSEGVKVVLIAALVRLEIECYPILHSQSCYQLLILRRT